MTAKRPSKPLSMAPAGTKFSGSKTSTDFQKPKKGAHSGAMKNTMKKGMCK
jgi:hypothetical protein